MKLNVDKSSMNDADRQPVGARVWETLLIALVFFVIAGDPPPNVNEPHYLCRLKHHWDPAWCAGDLFLDSPEAHLTFVWALGWVTRWLSLPATAWVGRVVAWMLLAWAWQRLSWRLVPVPLAALLSAALWVTLNEQAHLAGEWIVGGVEAKCFAYVLVLLALRELVDQRWNRVWLLLGAASALHALVGGWSVVLCGGVWLATRKGGSSVIAMLPGLAGGGLFALLGVVPALALTWNQPPELVADANRIYVFERLPHHLALLTLPAADVTHRVARHLVLLLLLWLFARASRGTVAAQDEQLGPRTGGLRQISVFAWGAALLAAIGFAIELVLWNDPLRAAALLRYYWFRLTDFAAPMAVALDATFAIAAGMRQRRQWAAWGLAAAVTLAAWQLTTASAGRLTNPVPPADRKMRDYAAWVDVCQWVADHTPSDALFLTPRLSHSFKWRTGRPEVATRKDVPQDARSIVEWFGRLRTIYYEQVDGEIQPVRSLGHLGTERIAELAKRYGVRYVLTDHRRPLKFPVAYWNAEYVLYEIEP